MIKIQLPKPMCRYTVYLREANKENRIRSNLLHEQYLAIFFQIHVKILQKYTAYCIHIKSILFKSSSFGLATAIALFVILLNADSLKNAICICYSIQEAINANY